MKPTEIDSPLLNTTEAAEYLRLKPSTLNSDRVTRRLGVPFRRHGRRIVYHIEDLAQFSKSTAVIGRAA